MAQSSPSSPITLPVHLSSFNLDRPNSQPPFIFQLPTELLRIIFDVALEDACPESIQYFYSLNTLRLVHRTWKACIDEAPHLWAVLRATDPPELLEASLYRSKVNPLLVYIHPSNPKNFLRSLEGTKHRWRALQINTKKGFIDAEDLKACILGTSQSLRDLRVKFTAYWNPNVSEFDTLDIEEFDSIAPNLHTMVLAGFWIKRRPNTLPSLKRLELAHIFSHSFQSVLQNIVTFTQLEELRIIDCPFGDSWHRRPPCIQPACLPRLSSFVIDRGVDGFVIDILQHLLPPPKLTTLRVEVEAWLGEAELRFLAALRPWLDVFNTAGSGFTEAYCVIADTTFAISFGPTLHIAIVQVEDDIVDICDSLNACMKLLRKLPHHIVAAVRTLHIVACDIAETYVEETLIALNSTFPHTTTLNLTGSPPPGLPTFAWKNCKSMPSVPWVVQERQVLTILSSVGCPTNVFSNLQKVVVADSVSPILWAVLQSRVRPAPRTVMFKLGDDVAVSEDVE